MADPRPHIARRARLGSAYDGGGFVDVVGGIVPVNMAGKALVRLALIMGMPMLRYLDREFDVPDGLGLSDCEGVVARRAMHRRQRHAERHRESDAQTGENSDAVSRHGESLLADFLTKV